MEISRKFGRRQHLKKSGEEEEESRLILIEGAKEKKGLEVVQFKCDSKKLREVLSDDFDLPHGVGKDLC